jgi:hypothetical protein
VNRSSSFTSPLQDGDDVFLHAKRISASPLVGKPPTRGAGGSIWTTFSSLADLVAQIDWTDLDLKIP